METDAPEPSGWSPFDWALNTSLFDHAASDLLEIGEAMGGLDLEANQPILASLYRDARRNQEFIRKMLAGLFDRHYPDLDGQTLLFDGLERPMEEGAILERGEDGRLSRDQWLAVASLLGSYRTLMRRVGNEALRLRDGRWIGETMLVYADLAGLPCLLGAMMRREHPEWRDNSHVFDAPKCQIRPQDN